jgi:thiol:disulfide interchange protein DsbD
MRSSWNKYFVILPTMLVGFSLFASTQWFLALGTSKSRNKLAWISQEKQALELARKTEAPLLIDVWAEWCESCKKMDLTTFSDDLVIKELKKNSWVLLKLDLTLSNDYTEKLRKKYKVTGLPTVIIKHPSKSEQLALNGFVSTQTLFEHIRKFSKEST